MMSHMSMGNKTMDMHMNMSQK